VTLPVTFPVSGPEKLVAVAVPTTCKAVAGVVVPMPRFDPAGREILDREVVVNGVEMFPALPTKATEHP